MKTSDSTQARHGRLLARFDRIPVATRSHRRWTLLLAGVFLFELADLNTFSLVAPELRHQWGLTVSDVGLVTSLGFVGMFLGSSAGGRLSDLFGRRPALIWSSVTFSVSSLLSATATNLFTLGLYRVLTGVGLTAMTSVGLAFISEMYPRALRGRYLALIFGAGLTGIPLVSWFARAVIPVGADGWRWVFAFGALGLVIAGLMARYLPESIRWQASREPTAATEALLARLEREAEAKYGGPLPAPVPERGPGPRRGRVSDLFGPRHRRKTVVFFVASVFALIGFYGYSGFAPTLLVEHGFSVVQSLTYTSIVMLGAIPGALLAWLFIDRWQRHRATGTVYLVIAVLAVVYGLGSATSVILVSGFLISMLLQTSTVLVYTYGPEIFPTELRGVGNGLGNGLGRLATFGSSNLLPWVYASFGYSSVFFSIAVALAIAGIALTFWGERTTGRPLDAETPLSDAGPGAAPTPRPTGSSGL